jgi:hypothetical protein
MNFVSRLGSYTQDSLLWIWKYYKIFKNFENGNNSGSKHFIWEIPRLYLKTWTKLLKNNKPWPAWMEHLSPTIHIDVSLAGVNAMSGAASVSLPSLPQPLCGMVGVGPWSQKERTTCSHPSLEGVGKGFRSGWNGLRAIDGKMWVDEDRVQNRAKQLQGSGLGAGAGAPWSHWLGLSQTAHPWG